jgi:chromosome segregation ATPase
MADQLDSRPSKSAPKARNITAGNGDQLDSAGQAILDLLHTAADEAETDSRQALETAQRLSSQFHAAQERIAELEAQVQQYREKADRAEEWLSKISKDIEDRLIKQPEERRREVSRR